MVHLVGVLKSEKIEHEVENSCPPFKITPGLRNLVRSSVLGCSPRKKSGAAVKISSWDHFYSQFCRQVVFFPNWGGVSFLSETLYAGRKFHEIFLNESQRFLHLPRHSEGYSYWFTMVLRHRRDVFTALPSLGAALGPVLALRERTASSGSVLTAREQR